MVLGDEGTLRGDAVWARWLDWTAREGAAMSSGEAARFLRSAVGLDAAKVAAAAAAREEAAGEGGSGGRGSAAGGRSRWEDEEEEVPITGRRSGERGGGRAGTGGLLARSRERGDDRDRIVIW